MSAVVATRKVVVTTIRFDFDSIAIDRSMTIRRLRDLCCFRCVTFCMLSLARVQTAVFYIYL